MRKFIFLVVIFFCSLLPSNASKEESFLIRRVYIDSIGVVPTIEEIDWYLVYNSNGYQLAVSSLANNPKYNNKFTTDFLLSNEYKNLPKKLISYEQLIKNIMFVVGMDINSIQTPENIIIAKTKFINNAILCSDGDSQTIDYICNSLMCRDANIVECNYLLKYLKISNNWMDVLDEILKFEDVCKY